MQFVRYSGAGNTFLLADNRKCAFDKTHVSLLCEAQDVDGLILVEHAKEADIFMRIYNCDGSVAEMCGNGMRCLIHYLKELGIERTIYHIDTLAGRHEGWFEKDEVAIQLPPPSQLKLNADLDLHFINTGVPHAVRFVKELETIDVESEGKAIRHSPLFVPAGTNVDFVRVEKDGSLSIRTYERGVEAETLACGTGAIASALIAHKIYTLPSPITVLVRSGEKLKISFTDDWSKVTLIGPVKRISEGNFEIKNETLIMTAL